MYIFCSEFCILGGNICWNFIILEIGGNNSDVATPDLFSSDHISLYKYNHTTGKLSKIVSYYWKNILWEENYKHFESLDGIINSTKCRLYLNL